MLGCFIKFICACLTRGSDPLQARPGMVGGGGGVSPSVAVASTQTPQSSSSVAGNVWTLLDYVISRHHLPSRHSQDSLAGAARLALHDHVGQALRGVKPRAPMPLAPYAACDDPVTRHGRQVQELRGLRRRGE